MYTAKNIGLTVLISAAFMATLALVLTFFPSTEETAKIEAVHLFIAMFPLIVLLILSGRLKEISGPGGISLTLQEEARKPISPELSTAKLEVDPSITMNKGGTVDLKERIGDTLPNTLSFVTGEGRYYNNAAIEEYLFELDRFPSFKYILFTKESDVFQGLMPVDDFKITMGETNMEDEIHSGLILKHPRTITASIRVESSNQQALNEMERLDTNTLAVVDRHEKFVGVITQEEIVRKALSKVMRQA